MKLITILDDKPSEHLGLAHEHGLSFFVEQNGHRVLFDFGSGIHTLENMRRLNIAPDSVEYAVGSHGHYDHAGGYPFLEEAGMHCPLVTGEGYFLEKYAGEGSRYTYLGTGFDADLLQRKGIRHRVCSSEIKLNASMTVMTAFERRWDFETIPERFVLRTENGMVPDRFADELCLIVQLRDGLMVIVGCSHPGILNILTAVQQRSGQPIRIVAGGTHLMEADDSRIRETLETMKRFGTRIIGFNHCSGSRIREIVREFPELNAEYLGAGDCLIED